MLIEQLCTFRRIGKLCAKGRVVSQALVAFDIQVEVRIQKDVKRTLYRGFSRCPLLVLVERLHAAVACDLGAPGEDRIEQCELVLEVIVHERSMDADLEG